MSETTMHEWLVSETGDIPLPPGSLAKAREVDALVADLRARLTKAEELVEGAIEAANIAMRPEPYDEDWSRIVAERDSLRAEVTRLRAALEEITHGPSGELGKHAKETIDLAKAVAVIIESQRVARAALGGQS